MKRVGVFVDIVHQFAAAQERYNKKIDYEKYLARAVGNDILFCALAYGAQINTEAQGFIKRLKQLGYEPKYKQAVTIGDNGKVDLNASDFIIEMMLDIIRYSEKLDCVVLGSNDPRFAPLLRFLQERAIRVIIFACKIPPELASIANIASEIPEEILERGRI